MGGRAHDLVVTDEQKTLFCRPSASICLYGTWVSSRFFNWKTAGGVFPQTCRNNYAILISSRHANLD